MSNNRLTSNNQTNNINNIMLLSNNNHNLPVFLNQWGTRMLRPNKWQHSTQRLNQWENSNSNLRPNQWQQSNLRRSQWELSNLHQCSNQLIMCQTPTYPVNPRLGLRFPDLQVNNNNNKNLLLIQNTANPNRRRLGPNPGLGCSRPQLPANQLLNQSNQPPGYRRSRARRRRPRPLAAQ